MLSMSSGLAGPYQIELRKGDIERFHKQGEAVGTCPRVMLDSLGVEAGLKCLIIGCGPRRITKLLRKRVGPPGRVVGLDKDVKFLAYARTHTATNVEFRHGDAYTSNLAAASFDLVHSRFVA